MLDPHTGSLEMLKPGDLRIQEPPPGKIIAFGTADEMQAVARKIRVANASLAKRAKRKQQQRSRKKNR